MRNMLRLLLLPLLLLAIALPLSAQAQDYTSDMIGRWRMDETGGTTLYDSVGGNNGSMINGGAVSIDGMEGKALDRTGTNQYFNMGDVLPLTGDQSFTLSLWINFNGDPLTKTDFLMEHGGNYWLWWNGANAIISGADNKLVFGFHGPGGNHDYTAAWTPSTGQWYLITAVHDASADTMTIYVDGQQLANFTGVTDTLSTSGTYNFMIGRRSVSAAYYFKGYMDDARIYNRALSAADVAALYETTHTVYACSNPSGVKAQITFNTDKHVIQYCDGTNWISAGLHAFPTPYVPYATYFDGGTAMYMGSSSWQLTDSKQITGSFWLKPEADPSLNAIFTTYNNSSNRFDIRLLASNKLQFYCKTGGTDILDIQSDATITDGQWHHVLFSFDMSDPTKRHLVIDGTQDAMNVTTYSDATLGLQNYYNNFGADQALPANYYHGELADFWFDSGVYVDFSQTSNIEKFIKNGLPVDINLADGSTPTGSQPVILLPGPPSTPLANRGSANDMGWRLGSTPTDASSNPSLTPVNGGLTTGLVGWWKLDETSGSTIADSSGNSVTGTWTDGVNDDVTEETTTGAINNSLSFGGSNTYITLGDIDAYDGLSDMTVSAWVKTTYTTEQQIIDKSTNCNGSNGVFELYTGWPASGVGGLILFNGGSYSYVTTTTSIADGSWHLLTATSDGSTMKIYLDGILSNTKSGTITPGSNTTTVSIGGYCGGSYASHKFHGNIDDVRIYNRVLSANDIEALYKNSTEYVCSNPDGKVGGITYNTTYNVMQFCNGYEWVAMGTNGAGGGGCSVPSGPKGSLVYNSLYNVMQYCDGTNWHGIGKTATPDLTGGLLAWWKLDETSGATMADSSGSGYDMTWQDGGDNVISIDDSASPTPDGTGVYMLNTTTPNNYITLNSRLGDPANLTISGWVNTNAVDSAGSTLLNIGGRAVIEMFSNKVEGTYGATSVWNRTTYNNSILGTGWVYLTWTFDDDNDTQVLYVNGSPVATTNYTESIDWSAGSSHTYLGRHDSLSTYDFTGMMDDVRVYDHALDATEVSTLYDSFTSVPDTLGLIGHWKLDETSGAAISDSSGFGNNGTWTDGADNDVSGETTTGTIDTALTMNGSDSIKVTNQGEYNFGTAQDFSLSAWVKMSAGTDGGYILSKVSAYSGSNPRWWMGVDQTNGKISAYLGNVSVVGNTDLRDGLWHLVTSTYDRNGNLTLYVDGASIGSASIASETETQNSRADIYIGTDTSSGAPFKGNMDDVRIYGHALTATEVSNLYSAGNGPLVSGLVAYYKLDETSGASIADSSGNGNNGTWTDGGDNSVSGETGTGVNGSSLVFNGTAKIQVPNSASLSMNDTATIAFWVKGIAGTSGYSEMVNKRGSTGLEIRQGSSSQSIDSRIDTSAATNQIKGEIFGRILDNAWKHIAFVYDNGTVSSYLNGSLVKSESYSHGTGFSNTNDLYIGNNSGGGAPTEGRLDDVRIYNTALSGAEISALYGTYTLPTPSIPTSGLIGEWNLNETSGSSIADSSGNSVTGTWEDGANNDVTEETTDGENGKALTFNGASTFIKMGDVNAYDGLSAITLSAWVKTSYTGEQTIIDKSTCNGSTGVFELYTGWPSSGVGGFALYHGGTTTTLETTGSITNGSWHMLTATYDGTTMKIYLDGTLDNSTSGSFTIASNTNIVSIGGYCNGVSSSPFNGNIDDVLIYNRALSATEITNMYNSY